MRGQPWSEGLPSAAVVGQAFGPAMTPSGVISQGAARLAQAGRVHMSFGGPQAYEDNTPGGLRHHRRQTGRFAPLT